jgi:Putative bacterial sensory transduction regulator
MGTRLGLAIVAGALIFPPASFAQKVATPPAAPPQSATQFTPDQVAAMVRGAGYGAEVLPNGKSFKIQTGMDGYKVFVYLYCSNGSCGSLDWDVMFTASPNYSLTLANEFNRQYRYAKVYIENDGALAVEYSVDFTGGISTGAIAQSAHRFDNLIADFEKFEATKVNGGK